MVVAMVITKLRTRLIFPALIALHAILAASPTAHADPVVYLTSAASPVEKDAAYEAQRYLYRLTGYVWPIKVDAPERGDGLVLGTPGTLPEWAGAYPFGLEQPHHDGYILFDLGDTGETVVVAGSSGAAVRHGVVDLVNRMGAGLYLNETTYPKDAVRWRNNGLAGLAESVSPVFDFRGAMPLHDHLMGAAAWSIPDYMHYIDGLTRLRLNVFAVRASADTPFAAYADNGAWRGGEPLPYSTDGDWTRPPVPAEEFTGGTSAYFAEDAFGGPASANGDAPFEQAQGQLADAFAYARGRGLTTVLALDVHGTPFNEHDAGRLARQLQHIITTYPHLDGLCLWFPEYHGPWPDYRTQWAAQARSWSRDHGEDHAFRAARIASFTWQAHQFCAALAPNMDLFVAGPEIAQRPAMIPGLHTVLPDTTRIMSESHDDGAVGIIGLERDGDLWMPQPASSAVRQATVDLTGRDADGFLAAHWRLREVGQDMSFLAGRAWNADLSFEDFLRERTAHLYGADDASALTDIHIRLDALGYRWVGGGGVHERYPFAWPKTNADNRRELANIAFDLRQIAGMKAPPDNILTEAAEGVVTGFRDVATAPIRFLLGGSAKPKNPRVTRLYDYITYVLGLDHALGRLALGPLPETANADSETLATWTGRSNLNQVLHTYGRHLTSKSDLGVLASINTRAWGAVLDEFPPAADDVYELTALPDDTFTEPVVRVLPDRVIVLGSGAPEELEVVVRARELGGRDFSERVMPHLGRGVFAFDWPEGVQGPVVEYGIEINRGAFSQLTWPERFPKETNVHVIHVRTADAKRERSTTERRRFEVTTSPNTRDRSVVLSWNHEPGERYTVARDGEVIGRTYLNSFVDFAPPSGEDAVYAFAARHLTTDSRNEHHVEVAVPAFPEASPPSTIEISTRNGYAILDWTSDDPRASGYRVTQQGGNLPEPHVSDFDSAFPHRLRMGTKGRRGEAYSFRIQARTAQGELSAPGPTPGIVIDGGPLRPVHELNVDDADFVNRLARLIRQGFAVGGIVETAPVSRTVAEGRGLTFACWVRFDDIEGRPVVISQGPWSRPNAYVQLIEGTLHFYHQDGGHTEGGQPQPGRWHFVAATYDNGQPEIFLDNRVVARAHPEGVQINHHRADEEMIPPAVYELRGSIDAVRIYDVALTPEELAAIRDASDPR